MPSKFTEDTIARIVQAIRMGATYDMAAKYGGITYQTFNEWRKKGDEAKTGAYRDFVEAVARAEGEAAVGWLAKIEKAAGEGVWQAAAWKLERRHPAQWARRNYARIEGMDELIRVAEEKGIPVGDVIAALVDTLNEVDDASDG